MNKTPTKLNNPVSAENSVAFIQHVGWLRHDHGEEVIHLLRQGHFEAAEQAFFWLYLRPDDTFIDCGAHVGLYSVLASQVTEGDVHIIAVEANAHTAQHLNFNLKTNGVTEATIVEAAIWDSLGEINFLESKKGEAAYDHVVFGNDSTGLTVSTTTLNKLVENSGGTSIALVKIDVEGAETEAIIGGKDAIAAGLLPVLMVEFTESNLQRRGLDTDHLYKQLEELGYTLCELHPERLQLGIFRPDGPIWYKNLFACRDLGYVNRRLESARDVNRKIALDILARAAACSPFKELEQLESFKQQAGQSENNYKLAKQAETFLAAEKANGEQLKSWAERSDAALSAEREISRQLRDWAKQAETFLAAEKANGEQLKSWAERSDAALSAEREISRQLRDWAKQAETFLAAEKANGEQLKSWAERSDAALGREREDDETLRQLAERTEELLAATQETVVQMREELKSRKKLLWRLVSWRLSDD